MAPGRAATEVALLVLLEAVVRPTEVELKVLDGSTAEIAGAVVFEGLVRVRLAGVAVAPAGAVSVDRSVRLGGSAAMVATGAVDLDTAVCRVGTPGIIVLGDDVNGFALLDTGFESVA